MTTLVITDIPRLADLFERVDDEQGGVIVVGEIHRGIEVLIHHKPTLVIIQNYLSGLSADIVHKHLKSRIGRRKVRFALISSSEISDAELSARFEMILDPALPDAELEHLVVSLLSGYERPLRRPQPAVAPADSDTAAVQQPELALPGLINPVPDAVETPPPTPVVAAVSPAVELQRALPTAPPPPPVDEHEAEPETYSPLRRPNRAIVSAFSQHLDSTVEELTPQERKNLQREQELAIKDMLNEPYLADDMASPAASWLQRPLFWVFAGTVVFVIAVTLFQNRGKAPQKTDGVVLQPTPKISVTPKPDPAAAPLTVQPAPTQPASALSAPEVTLQNPSMVSQTPGALQSHGVGRPKALPSFIPQAGLDKEYGKEHPGWESYQGQAHEYRVFREKDKTIKAIQILDRSGVGIQESFYVGILKELAGATAMRPSASEVKEGYEIRRGDAAGLQFVQYRDAQGGRMRGFVITWP